MFRKAKDGLSLYGLSHLHYHDTYQLSPLLLYELTVLKSCLILLHDSPIPNKSHLTEMN